MWSTRAQCELLSALDIYLDMVFIHNIICYFVGKNWAIVHQLAKLTKTATTTTTKTTTTTTLSSCYEVAAVESFIRLLRYATRGWGRNQRWTVVRVKQARPCLLCPASRQKQQDSHTDASHKQPQHHLFPSAGNTTGLMIVIMEFETG